MDTHIDLKGGEGEEPDKQPQPLPLTSPSHVVKEWVVASPYDVFYLTKDGASSKVCVWVCEKE